MNVKWVRFFLLAILGMVVSLNAAEKKGLGLKPLTEEHIQQIEQNSQWVVKVKPNKLGAARIHEHLKKQGKEPIELDVIRHHHDEVATHFGLTKEIAEKLQAEQSASPLPSAVDNSILPSFPPIGDQQQLGSCVAWGSTYYQATHEYGLLNGINNKNGNRNILSPKWTYNLLNDGYDDGLIPTDAFTLLSQNGATTLANFPYDGVDYLGWDLNPQDWVSAISYRMAPVQMITGIGGAKQNLQTIKQLLNNGHVLTFATFVNSWVYTKVKKDPSNPNSPAVGQKAVSWMNGTNGGHFLTIVGYNDNIWIDINGSGKVDAGEKGAFLVANSWGTDWGNNGFIWIAYDAFLATSAVSKGPKSGRVPLAAAMNSYVASVVPKAVGYTPRLVTQFTLSQDRRDQISVGAGASNLQQTTPSSRFASKALVYGGGSYEFDGSNPATERSATFALDLTDLIPAQNSSSTDCRYYLVLGDDQRLNPTTLSSFSLVDLTHQHQVDYTQVPVVFDNTSTSPHIDYNFYTVTAQPRVAPTVAITSHADGATLQGQAHITAQVSSQEEVSKVDFYVDEVLYLSDTTPPYIASIDTTQLSNGPHEIKAVVYDADQSTHQSTIAINVGNSLPSIYVNAGGGEVVYQENTWSQDHGFSSPSEILSTLFNFDNPVYQTERNGNFSYLFEVENGSYTVTLKFAEFRYPTQGRRLFDVTINGVKVVDHLDLAKVAGYRVPYDLSFPVNVTDGQIKINFISILNKAKVNGIQITAN